jgi:hypothetical protein
MERRKAVDPIFDFGTQVMTAAAECISHQSFPTHENECLSALKEAFDSSIIAEPFSSKEKMVQFLVERTIKRILWQKS